jgi:bacteriocin biosynthesis cyclodehydratase domain-containing protein
LADTDRTVSATRQAALISMGDFGGAVARNLLRRPDCAAWPLDLESAFSGPADVVVIAMWRQDGAVCETADDLAFQFSRPWLPITMDHPRVRIGPLVVPGTGPCYGCFLERRAQHDAQLAITSALNGAYRDDPDAGPRGYLDHHARLAAGLAQLTIESLRRGPADSAGRVLSFNVLRRGIRAHRVLGCGDCRRCSPARGAPAARWQNSYLARFVRDQARVLPALTSGGNADA